MNNPLNIKDFVYTNGRIGVIIGIINYYAEPTQPAWQSGLSQDDPRYDPTRHTEWRLCYYKIKLLFTSNLTIFRDKKKAIIEVRHVMLLSDHIQNTIRIKQNELDEIKLDFSRIETFLNSYKHE
jgi:hypothetical protein